MHRATRIKLAALVSAGAIAVVAGGAFTASNTMGGAPNAGVGSTAVTGYAISAITYDQDATDPTMLDAVNFTISPAAASSVKARLTDSGAWYDCVNTAGSVVCNTDPSGTMADIDNLTVVATA